MSHSHRTYYVGLATRISLLSWPCRDSFSGSLYPLPPGRCRREAFCPSCGANTCLFGGTPVERRMGKKERWWALPDEISLDLYIAALQRYTSLLKTGRTCWHCANLRRLQGEGRCYVCLFAAETEQQSSSEGLASVTMTAWQAQLRTARESCGERRFRVRAGAIACLTATEWRAILAGEKVQGCCAWCAHLQRLVLGTRERFVCLLETDGWREGLVWRAARSWRVVKERQQQDSWCSGRFWRPREEAISLHVMPAP
ncbi:MAG: hypothetical protein ACUVWR_12880 [Anaerolineae bacterium]